MVRAAANRMKEILGLDTEPVAVFLLPSGADNSAFDGFVEVAGHRYCQLLMRARHGESLRLAPDGLACPAAASAFGFKPLPEGLAAGKGLFYRQLEMGIEAAYQLAGQTMAFYMMAEPTLEGVQAFIEKRKPNW